MHTDYFDDDDPMTAYVHAIQRLRANPSLADMDVEPRPQLRLVHSVKTPSHAAVAKPRRRRKRALRVIDGGRA
jgi:hypothetical protein